LGGLWALEWAWHCTETNLRCAGISGICVPNPSIGTLIVSEISAFIRTDGQTDMARSTRLVILIKNTYTLWGRKRFLLPVTYFPTNLVYPFTLRVTGIIIGFNLSSKESANSLAISSSFFAQVPSDRSKGNFYISRVRSLDQQPNR